MTRGALLVSLVLHAGLLTMLGRWWPSEVLETGSGNPGVAVSFLSDDSEAAPRSAAPAPALTPPDFAPPAPVAEPPITPVPASLAAPSLLFVEHESSPVAKPQTAPAKNPTGTRIAGASSEKVSRPRGPSGSAGSEGGERRTAGYVPPQFRVRYKPPYPAEARAQRWEGTVLLLVSVDAAGRVTRAAVRRSCGHPVLDRSALDSVRTWRFEPARQNGLTTAAEVEVPVRFCFS